MDLLGHEVFGGACCGIVSLGAIQVNGSSSSFLMGNINEKARLPGLFLTASR